MNTTVTPSTQMTYPREWARNASKRAQEESLKWFPDSDDLSPKARAEQKRRREEAIQRFPLFMSENCAIQTMEYPPFSEEDKEFFRQDRAFTEWRKGLPPLPR